MSTSSPVAVDATSARQLDHELLRGWDAYLGDGRREQVRMRIVESWRRSQSAGIDPLDGRAPTMLASRRDVRERWDAHPLGTGAPLIRRWLRAFAEDSDYIIMVTDSHGMVLWVHGDTSVRSQVADAWNTVEGALWTEAAVGTNAIGTALAGGDAVHVRAAEHFSAALHQAACSAAPVHDPEDGRLIGVIDVTGSTSKLLPDSLAAALAAARAVEADLRSRMQMRDARLRVRYLERIASAAGKLALVSGSGRVIADHPDGLIGATRVQVPAGGGVVILPGGRPGIAEPLDGGDGYMIRAVTETGGSRARSELRTPGVESEPAAAPGGVSEWRGAQLELSRLAEEQAALRRVATLVAGHGTAEEIFATVAEEVAELLGADHGFVWRYEPDGSMTAAAFWTRGDGTLPVGTRVELKGDSVAARVRQSGRPGRLDSYAGLSGPVIDLANALGAGPRSTVGAPILAEGRVWGVILVVRTGGEEFAQDTESRLVDFAQLLATAISNALTLEELHASRARIVAAADAERRRIERDLHDGAQQQLVWVGYGLRAVREALDRDSAAAATALDEAIDGLTRAAEDLRELARGIHPALLIEGGLEPALTLLAERSVTPVTLEVAGDERFPEAVEIAAYFVVSEALTNVARHANAAQAKLIVRRTGGTVVVEVVDDGRGGADTGSGSGLRGLQDRISALGGNLTVESPPGRGTVVRAEIPCV